MSTDDEKSMIAKLLRFDALDHIQKTTGLPYHDEVNIARSFKLFTEQNAARSAILSDMGDSTFNESLDGYLNIVQNKLGFGMHNKHAIEKI
jgi:hypothetical protein